MERKTSFRTASLALGAMLLSACGGLIPAAQPPYRAEQIQIGTGADYPRAERPAMAYTPPAPQPARRGGPPPPTSAAAPARAPQSPSATDKPQRVSDYMAQYRASPPPASSQRSTRQSARIASAPLAQLSHPQDRACIAELDQTGARFTPVADTYTAPGCHLIGTVRLTDLPGDNARFGVTNLGAVKCDTAAAFAAWARYGVDRAARQLLGAGLDRIETMGSYACRTVAGSTRLSAHATGNAIDVSAFVLSDGRRISLKDDWRGGTAAEREFLRVVHKSACKRFGTVLGPEYDRAHEDHFHLEGSDAQFCR